MSNSDAWRELVAHMLATPGVGEAPSRWAGMPALWVDGREFAHAGEDGWLDVRLTREVIRANRPELRASASVELRPSRRDWVKFRFDEPAGFDLALDFCKMAAAANRR